MSVTKTPQSLSEVNKLSTHSGQYSLAGECNVKRWALRSILSYSFFELLHSTIDSYDADFDESLFFACYLSASTL